MKQLQYERLFSALRRKAMTYLELQLLGVSTAPHKRLAEGEHTLRERGERLVRGRNRQGLVTFRVVKAEYRV